jgi:hypothetical protein
MVENWQSGWLRWPGPVVLGLVLGAVFGIGNLIATRLDPLSEDSPRALLLFYGPMFTIWGVVGFLATRRTGRVLEGVNAGALAALVTFVVFDLTVILRANLFLDELSQRSDWQGLMARYQASGFTNLRLFANYVYLTDAPLKILVATTIGAVMGSVGGLFGRIGRAGYGRAAA